MLNNQEYITIELEKILYEIMVLISIIKTGMVLLKILYSETTIF